MTCKIVPDMTYNVFGGTINLAQPCSTIGTPRMIGNFIVFDIPISPLQVSVQQLPFPPVFTVRMHVIQHIVLRRLFCLSVRPSLCPSVKCVHCYTRNSSGDEIANVNFLYDDIIHVLQNTMDS